MIAFIRAIIASAAITHGVNVDFADSVARCESTYRPTAVSRDGTALGLYQLRKGGKLTVFYRAGFDDVWDPAQQAEFFSSQIADGQAWAWSCAKPLLALNASLFLSPTSSNVPDGSGE